MITLFEQVVDNNSLKTLLYQFSHYFDTVCCHYVHDRLYRNKIKFIKAHITFLKQHAQNPIFLLFCKLQTTSDKISWEFKKLCLKFLLYSYTMLRTHKIACRNSCSLFLNIVKRWNGVEIKNCLNSSFSHSFCHWL